jgi:hypothetical protein
VLAPECACHNPDDCTNTAGALSVALACRHPLCRQLREMLTPAAQPLQAFMIGSAQERGALLVSTFQVEGIEVAAPAAAAAVLQPSSSAISVAAASASTSRAATLASHQPRASGDAAAGHVGPGWTQAAQKIVRPSSDDPRPEKRLGARTTVQKLTGDARFLQPISETHGQCRCTSPSWCVVVCRGVSWCGVGVSMAPVLVLLQVRCSPPRETCLCGSLRRRCTTSYVHPQPLRARSWMHP